MNGETILCIAPRVWDSLWRDTQPIMWQIAKQNRVLYLEPGRNPDRPHLAEMWRNLPNFWRMRSHELHKDLIAITTPSCLPVMRRQLPRVVLRVWMPWVTKINAWILIRHIRQVVKAFNVRDPILWLYSPSHVELVGKFKEKLACFYNYDEFPDFVNNRRIADLVRQFDNRLTSQVDVVFATSQAQCKRRRTINPNTYFVPNGVDFSLFNRALVSDIPLHPDIATLPRPIIGFVGWLGYNLDVELLRRVAEAYSDCSLVLIGPNELPNSTDKEWLLTRPNVFFLGQKDRQELPNYLQAFDVALMPYILSGHVLSIYPLKLHEYLAAGRDIVAVALPELQPYNKVVRIAETHERFISLIREALQDSTPGAVEMRVAVAKKNTWDQRIEEIYRVIQAHPKMV